MRAYVHECGRQGVILPAGVRAFPAGNSQVDRKSRMILMQATFENKILGTYVLMYTYTEGGNPLTPIFRKVLEGSQNQGESISIGAVLNKKC